MSTIQTMIKQLKASGLRQIEISRRTGIPQPRLSRWETRSVPRPYEDIVKLVEMHQQLVNQAEPESTGEHPEQQPEAQQAA